MLISEQKGYIGWWASDDNVCLCAHTTHCMALHTCVCVTSWNTNKNDLQTQRRSSDTFQSALPSCKSSHFLPALPPPAEWTVRRIVVERSVHYSRPLQLTGWTRLNKGLKFMPTSLLKQPFVQWEGPHMYRHTHTDMTPDTHTSTPVHT